jgi:uncharacterized protein (DUF433 family)
VKIACKPLQPPRSQLLKRTVPETGPQIRPCNNGCDRSIPFGSTLLAIKSSGRLILRIQLKARAQGLPRRIELGRYIVADPKICGGQPTFKGIRILVWIVLEQLGEGLTWGEVKGEWDGKVTGAAIAEAIAIAGLVESVTHEICQPRSAAQRSVPSRFGTVESLGVVKLVSAPPSRSAWLSLLPASAHRNELGPAKRGYC